MKPSLYGFRFILAGIFLLAGNPLFGQTNASTPAPHFEPATKFDSAKPPNGLLGLPLGTFEVIEGKQEISNMLNNGLDFVVEAVNGKKLDHEVRVRTDWPADLRDKRIAGKWYVLHGYETGSWSGAAQGVPREENYQVQSNAFFYQSGFTVTSVEKSDGVTVPDARPVDHNASMAVPNFTPIINQAIPIGILGLELGTYATIHVHTPRGGPPTMEIPIVFDVVDGQAITPQQGISIPGFTLGINQQATLNGYEIGVWKGVPPLPKTEFPSKPQPTPQGDNSFRYINEFMVISVAKPASAFPGP